MYEGPIQELIDELARLPGVGPKSAQRLAFWLVKATPEDAKRLAAAIVQAKDRIAFCRECGNVAEGDLCRICRDESRDRTLLCVVEEPKDAATIEKAALHKGRYHILGGAISPLDGIGPDDLRVQELLDRVERDHVTEVILATNPNLEGNATAMYVAALLKPARDPRDEARERPPGRRRPRVRGRGHALAGDRGPARDLADQAIARRRRTNQTTNHTSAPSSGERDQVAESDDHGADDPKEPLHGRGRTTSPGRGCPRRSGRRPSGAFCSWIETRRVDSATWSLMNLSCPWICSMRSWTSSS